MQSSEAYVGIDSGPAKIASVSVHSAAIAGGCLAMHDTFSRSRFWDQIAAARATFEEGALAMSLPQIVIGANEIAEVLDRASGLLARPAEFAMRGVESAVEAFI